MITRCGTYYYADKTIEICCAECGKTYRIPATPEQYNRIVRGSEAIQDILPKIRAGVRELFLSGLCDNCFDEAFDDGEF